MDASLRELQRALAGDVGFSSPLEAIAAALAIGVLPAAWARLNPATEKPLAPWLAWLLRRHAQYEAWAATGEAPPVVWLAGLHVPETFLAALVQTACRARGWALDRSALTTTVTRVTNPAAITARAAAGCSYVTGLYLEGAAWDVEAGELVRQAPKQLVTELPVMLIAPAEASRLRCDGTFRTPVYVTQARRDAMGRGLVFEADLATREHASHWVLQGVALTLNVVE